MSLYPPLRVCKLKKKKRTFITEHIQEMCRQTSLHGLHHIIQEKRHLYERIFWVCFFVMAVFGASFTSSLLWKRFAGSSTVTVVETMYYDYANVPFPSVTLCDSARVDWTRVLALQPQDLPQVGNHSRQQMFAVLDILGRLAFGDFHILKPSSVAEHTLMDLNRFNISELLLKVQRPCHEVFHKCWWRNRDFNCCSLFELQKSEYGWCWSFNSDTSQISLRKLLQMKNHLEKKSYWWLDHHGNKRPRRAAGYGVWTGLRYDAKIESIVSRTWGTKPPTKFYVNLPAPESLPPSTKIRQPKVGLCNKFIQSDVMSRLTMPLQGHTPQLSNWPDYKYPIAFPFYSFVFLSAGTYASVGVSGDALYSVPRVRQLQVHQRQCIFPFEAPILDLPFYLQHNCKVACYKEYALRYCGCVPEFMFLQNESNPDRACTAEGFMCLNKHNSVFNYDLPSVSLDFFDDNMSGMRCSSCLPDCNSQSYKSTITTSQNINSSNDILLDIHFESPSCTLYKTDLVYSWLDLLVSFGGIAGLFLGGSLLSGIEVIYFLSVRLYYHWKNQQLRIKPTHRKHLSISVTDEFLN